jgi:hypothetical protein
MQNCDASVSEVIDDLGVVNWARVADGNSLRSQKWCTRARVLRLRMPTRFRSSACSAQDDKARKAESTSSNDQRLTTSNYGVGGDGLPITSPVTTMSTRRLSWRPAAVLLSATGSALPIPVAVT